MKCKNAVWISLVCGVGLVCSPVLAQGAQQDAPPPPNGQQSGARPGLPPPPPPVLSQDERDAQRTIPGPYRLTYTFRELEGNKRIGTQQYAVALDTNPGWTTLKLGTKVPIAVAEYRENRPAAAPTEISYIDIGMNFQCRLHQFANGMELQSHVVQSAIDTEQTNANGPVIRQSDLQGAVLLQENKPVIIGTVNLPGTTHVLEIQVELTKLP
jgi:hypothetical protein